MEQLSFAWVNSVIRIFFHTGTFFIIKLYRYTSENRSAVSIRNVSLVELCLFMYARSNNLDHPSRLQVIAQFLTSVAIYQGKWVSFWRQCSVNWWWIKTGKVSPSVSIGIIKWYTLFVISTVQLLELETLMYTVIYSNGQCNMKPLKMLIWKLCMRANFHYLSCRA